MKKIKNLILPIIGGLALVARTSLTEFKAIINAESSAVISAERNAGISAERSAGISAERSAAKNIEKEIKPTKDLESKLEKIIDIIDIIKMHIDACVTCYSLGVGGLPEQAGMS